jgi:hypothetical protein
MKRALLAVATAVGLTALWRRRQRRKRQEELPAGPDPAAELRAKLDESRAAAAAAAEEPAPDEPIAAPVEASPLDPEARRRTVHDQARASIEDLGAD